MPEKELINEQKKQSLSRLILRLNYCVNWAYSCKILAIGGKFGGNTLIAQMRDKKKKRLELSVQAVLTWQRLRYLIQ